MLVALIGCGVIGPTHAHAIALDGRARLHVACDLDLAKARARIQAPHYSGDWRAVVQDPAIDVVAIATQHPAHADMACAALAAGKHVVCEKPLASHPEDLARMCAGAASSGRVASGIFQHRFMPLARRLRELLAGGDFGRVRRASLRFACSRTPAYYAADPWRGSWTGEGGGVLINQGIHSLDLLVWFCGTPVRVAGRVERRHMACIEVEDHAEGVIDFAEGAQAAIRADNDPRAKWDIELRVEAERGSFTLGDGHHLAAFEHPNQALRAEVEALDKVHLDGIRMPGKDVYGNHHSLQWQDVISAIAAGRRPFVSFEDARAANAVVLALYHASASGAPASIPTTGYQQPHLPLRAASQEAAP